MKAKAYFIISMIIFGAVGIFAKYINILPSILALYLSLVGSLLLLSIYILNRQQLNITAVKSNIYPLIISGITLSGNWIFLFQAYKETTIANAALSYYFAPVIVIGLSPIILKDKLSLKQLLCVIIALAGLFLILHAGYQETANANLLGIGYGLIAAAFYAAMTITNKFIHEIDGLTETIIQLGISAVILFIFTILTSGGTGLFLTTSDLFWILLFGILHGGIGFYLFFSGMKGLKANSIAILSYIDPLISLLISIVIIREEITLLQLLGAFMLLLAIGINEIATAKPQHNQHKR